MPIIDRNCLNFRLKNYWVCGIAPMDGGRQVLLLTVHKEGPSKPPRMMLVEPHQKSYTRISGKVIIVMVGNQRLL